ncbi:hypothetical protein, partial [Streptomyces sp. NPDC002172]
SAAHPAASMDDACDTIIRAYGALPSRVLPSRTRPCQPLSCGQSCRWAARVGAAAPCQRR